MFYHRTVNYCHQGWILCLGCRHTSYTSFQHVGKLFYYYLVCHNTFFSSGYPLITFDTVSTRLGKQHNITMCIIQGLTHCIGLDREQLSMDLDVSMSSYQCLYQGINHLDLFASQGGPYRSHNTQVGGGCDFNLTQYCGMVSGAKHNRADPGHRKVKGFPYWCTKILRICLHVHDRILYYPSGDQMSSITPSLPETLTIWAQHWR